MFTPLYIVSHPLNSSVSSAANVPNKGVPGAISFHAFTYASPEYWVTIYGGNIRVSLSGSVSPAAAFSYEFFTVS